MEQKELEEAIEKINKTQEYIKYSEAPTEGINNVILQRILHNQKIILKDMIDSKNQTINIEITKYNQIGKDTTWYNCPECSNQNIHEGAKCCSNCGKNINWI